MKHLLISSLCLLLITACNKPEESTQLQPENNTIRLSNTFDQQAYVRIYENVEDYHNNALPISEYAIAPNTTITISNPEYKQGQRYYFDAYTSGYESCNWGEDEDLQQSARSSISFVVPAEAPVDIFSSRSSAYKYLLDAYTYKTWAAADEALDANNHNHWQSLSYTEQTKQITFRKDMKAIYYYTDSNLIEHFDTLAYKIQFQAGSDYISIKLGDENNNMTMWNGVVSKPGGGFQQLPKNHMVARYHSSFNGLQFTFEKP